MSTLHEAPIKPFDVGLVMPAYNEERFIPSAIEAIQNQTYEDFTLIVVDDGSTDRTGEIAEKYAAEDSRLHVVHQRNGGVAAARNTGLGRLPETNSVTFPDADDVWLKGALEHLVDSLEANPHSVGVHGLAEYIDEHGDTTSPGWFSGFTRDRHVAGPLGRLLDVPVEQPSTFASIIQHCKIYPTSVSLLRRDVLDKLGSNPYKKEYEPFEDWEVFNRLARFGDIAFTNTVVLHYRQHDNNISKDANGPKINRKVRVATATGNNTKEQHAQVVRAWRATERQNITGNAEQLSAALRERKLPDAARSAASLALASTRFALGRPTRATLDFK